MYPLIAEYERQSNTATELTVLTEYAKAVEMDY
jgi:hypothetical protein